MLSSIVLKNFFRILIIAVLVFLLSQALKAQEAHIKLEKNRNIQAKNLVHQLNATKDTLILSSDHKINYLYTINKDYKRDIELNVNAKYFEFPLNSLKKGKHVFVAVQSPKRIVFVIKVLEEITSNQPDCLTPCNTMKPMSKDIVATMSQNAKVNKGD